MVIETPAHCFTRCFSENLLVNSYKENVGVEVNRCLTEYNLNVYLVVFTFMPLENT